MCDKCSGRHAPHEFHDKAFWPSAGRYFLCDKCESLVRIYDNREYPKGEEPGMMDRPNKVN